MVLQAAQATLHGMMPNGVVVGYGRAAHWQVGASIESSRLASGAKGLGKWFGGPFAINNQMWGEGLT